MMFKNILVPLDGSPLAEGTLPHVLTMAGTFDARVTLVRVSEEPPPSESDAVNYYLRKAEADAYLRQQAALLQTAGLTVETHLLEGPPANRIVEYARRQDADLIILSSHGSGGPSAWQVSHIAQKVLQRAMTSILLVHADQTSRGLQNEVNYRRILVPLDGSRRAECVLPVATSLAQHEQAELLLAHVTSRPFLFHRLPPTAAESAATEQLIEQNRARAAQYFQELAPRLDAHVQTALPVGDSVALALHTLVAKEEIDLAIFSAHGHSAQSQWAYGSVVSNFITNGSIPLLIIQDLPQSLARQQQTTPDRRKALHRPIESAPTTTGSRKKARTPANHTR